MIEKRLEKIENDIKSLKSSMPISGSTIDTYILRNTTTKRFADGEDYTCTVRFIPKDGKVMADGIVEFSVYVEHWIETWGDDNPVMSVISNGYKHNQGVAEIIETGGHSSSDRSPWEARMTAVAYGTLDGTIEFEWS